MASCGAGLFEPFVEKLARGEDFTIDDLKRACRAATGRALRVNAMES